MDAFYFFFDLFILAGILNYVWPYRAKIAAYLTSPYPLNERREYRKTRRERERAILKAALENPEFVARIDGGLN